MKPARSRALPLSLVAFLGLAPACGAQTNAAPAPPIAPPALAPVPVPASLSAAPVPPLPASEAPRTALTVVVRTTLPVLEVQAFPGGAVISAKSFLAVVSGEEIRQDPTFLDGTPEYINWDGGISIQLPPLSESSSTLTIPRNAAMLAAAGNRHGPAAELLWNGQRWIEKRAPVDPRLSRLPRDDDATQLSRALPTGHLLVLRASRTSVESRFFSPGTSDPAAGQVPLEKPEWASAQLVGDRPEHIHLCTFLGEIMRFDGASWTVVTLPDRSPESCAVTRDGALWVLASAAGKRVVLRRDPQGAFREVPLPEGMLPEGVAAAGDRLWVTALSNDRRERLLLSSSPVKEPVTLGDGQMPADPPEELTGLSVRAVPVPSVSSSPPGPGTSACPSVVVYLGKTLPPRLLAVIRDTPATQALPLVETSGTATGKAVLVRGAQMGVQPSTQRTRGFALLAPGAVEGMDALEAVAAALPETTPRLLCAKPRITRTIRP